MRHIILENERYDIKKLFDNLSVVNG